MYQKKIKILFSVHTYTPGKNGVQKVTEYIAEGLFQRGYDVSVITQISKSTPPYEVINGIKIYRINARTTMLGYSGDKGSYLRLIDEINPDIFVPVCTQSWTLDWLPQNLSILPGKKILYTHGYSGLTYKLTLGNEDISKKVKIIIAYLIHKIRWTIYYSHIYKKIKKFDKVTYLCETDSAYLYAKKHGLNNGCVLENAVDDILFKGTSHIENDPPRIICVSNYLTTKNQKKLMDEYYRMQEPAQLDLIGSKKTDYYNELCAYAESMSKIDDSKKVNIYVNLSREETLNKLKTADIFATASRGEAYPLVAFEAMASGLPVVATDVGNLSTIEGIYIADKDGDMAVFLDELCKSKEIRNTIGVMMREYAIQHNRIQTKVDEFDIIVRGLFN